MQKPKLVLATHNPGKLKLLLSFKEAPLLKTFEIVTALDLDLEVPEETGSTFHENAYLKALRAAQTTQCPALGDDSGLVVPALGGAPGLYSGRWAGPDQNYSRAFQRLEQELKETGADPHPAAYFYTVLALVLPTGAHEFFEGKYHGTLTFPPRGTQGFGYMPVFIPLGETRTMAEMIPEEHNRLSHRAHAMRDFLTHQTLLPLP